MTIGDPSDPSPKSERSSDDVEIDVAIDARKTSIFTLYAKIFQLLLTTQTPNLSLLSDEQRDRELEKLILPSNEEWRHRVYHSLVELQREKDAETEDKRTEDPKRHTSRKDSQDWEWRPREGGHLPKGRRDESQDVVASLKAISGSGGSMTEACVEPGWRVNDIVLAAKVLQNARPSPNYANEAVLFQTFGLKDIEDALLKAKTHLAASISRLRIGGSALSLGYF